MAEFRVDPSYVDALVRFLRHAAARAGPRSDPAGLGPFVTRERFRGPTAPWSSGARARTASRPGRLDAGRGSTWWAPSAVGWWIGVLFAIGSLCFAVGALPGYVDWVGTDADAITFFVGSIFFTTAALLQFLQTVNATARRSAPRAPAIGSASGRGSRGASTGARAGCSSSAPSSSTSRTLAAIDSQPRRDAGRPPRVGARRGRLDLLPRGQRPRWFEVSHGWWSWQPAEHLVADRRARTSLGSIAFGVSAVAS